MRSRLVPFVEASCLPSASGGLRTKGTDCANIWLRSTLDVFTAKGVSTAVNFVDIEAAFLLY